jgi:hypothetical protein
VNGGFHRTANPEAQGNKHQPSPRFCAMRWRMVSTIWPWPSGLV